MKARASEIASRREEIMGGMDAEGRMETAIHIRGKHE